MEYILFSENIRIHCIIDELNERINGYENYKLNMDDNNYLHLPFSIKLFIDSYEKNKSGKNIETHLANIYDAFFNEEKINKKDIYFLLSKIIDFNIEDQFYNTIISKRKTKPIAANSAKEKLLVEIITYFGDRSLFINCDYEKSKKWYELLNKKMFNEDNIGDIKSFVENMDSFCKNGFFLYTYRKYNNVKLQIELVLLDKKTNYLDITDCVKYTNEIFKFYFSIKSDIREITEARKVFCEILYRINQVLIQNIYSIIESNKKISNEIKNNIVFLSSIVYENELVPYKNYIILNKKRSNIIKTIFNLVNSIINIEKIKSNLLISKNDKPSLAYYTKIDSFSYMLPYKNIHEKSGYLPLMNISYMNDPTEGTVIYRYLSIKNEKNKREEAKLPYIFIKSFTSSIDYLPMWEMYGDKAKGICVVLDWPKIKKENVELYRICYVSIANNGKHKIIAKHNSKIKKIKKIKEELDIVEKIRTKLDKSLLDIYDDSLNRIAYLFKDDHYYTEEEYRILQSDKEYNPNIKRSIEKKDDINIYQSPLILKYADFIPHIKEIIIGPKYENVDCNFPFIKTQIELMCKQRNMDMPRITYSDIDYR